MKWTADFETTTKVDDCRVWAYGIYRIGSDADFRYGNSLNNFMEWCSEHDSDYVYFHNLKFDGEFILNWLFSNGYTHVNMKRPIEKKTFTTLISDKGMFYSIIVRFENDSVISFYDSLKIIPFSVDRIATGFGLNISKLKINYDDERKIGHELTNTEIDYIRNDVEIVAQALNVLFEQKLNKITQGSNALADYKRTVGTSFKKWFPVPDYDADIRQSYKGGFTYVNPRFINQRIGQGIVLDVNSLYPSVMYYNMLPFGEGISFEGKYKKDKNYPLYVQMFKCKFKLKDGFIPTIQLKNTLGFAPTEYAIDSGNNEVTICLTSVDLKLFFTHYDVNVLEWVSGWKFKAQRGMFSDYIDKWITVKNDATLEGNEAMRTLAKLMLNALYGKFALNPNVRSKIPYWDEKMKMVRYKLGEKEIRKPVYIPVGTFITAWARYKTITSAQECFDRFLYADTDSLHLIGTDYPDGLEIDKVKLGAWKHENTFEYAKFIRAKCYCEFYNGKLHVTCAGMPAKCHDGKDKLSDSELEAIESGRLFNGVTFDNFKVGSTFAGKLKFHHTSGGIVLLDTPFTIKE